MAAPRPLQATLNFGMGLYDRLDELRVDCALRLAAPKERRLLESARLAHESAIGGEDPLVSVTIPTFNRADLLIKSTIPSVLHQSHLNLEVIVVGDGCTDDTAARMAKVADPRVRFINLPRRGDYPTDRRNRWRVAGTHAINHAMAAATGTWIAHLDDDDLFDPDHVARLLRHALAQRLEFVYSKTEKETRTGRWKTIGLGGWGGEAGRIPAPVEGSTPLHHSSVLFRTYLRLFRFDLNAWKLGLPGDEHVWRRMRHSGVRAGFVDEVTVRSPLRPGTTIAYFLSEDRD